MKNYLYLGIMAAAMSFTACSSEEPVPQAGGDATVTFSVQLPGELNSRYGEGTTATNLKIAVYAKGETATPLNVFKLETGDSYTDGAYTSTIAMTKNVQMQLASGKTYTVVCWADAPGSIYTFSAADQKVTAKYETTTVANAEAYDAFFASQEITVSGNESKTIELRRPFAQLNVFTDDIAAAAAAGFTTSQTMVTVPVATTLNLVEGTVDDAVEQTFNYATLPSGKMGTTAYEYLLMNYLLTGADKSIVDVKFAVKSTAGEERALTFNSVPVQRNYKTNIYGSLLTNAMNFNVVIKPEFEDGYDHPVVNAATQAELLAVAATGGDVKLTSAMDFTEVVAVDNHKGLTVDLNKQNIANTTDLWDANPYQWSLFSVRDGSTLTLKGDGNVIAKANDCYAVDVQDGGHLVIEGGHYNGNIHAVYVEKGIAEIKGGTFEIQQLYPDATKAYGFVLNCYDANRANGTAKIIVTGGKFINFNPADCWAEGEHTNFVAAGYKSVETSTGVWEVVPE